MSEFNVDEYFTSRSKAFKAPDGSDFINAKYLELQQTTQNKVRELAERSSLAAKQEAVDADTWGGKLDLAPHSLQGNVVNVVGSVYQGATGVAGRVLSAAPSALAAANQANLSEDDIVALERHQKGQSTPEDLARINRKVAPIVAPTPGMPRDLAQAHANERAQFMADMNPNAPTPLKIWTEMNKAREISRGINESADNSSVVRLRDQAAFGADLTNTYNDNAPQIAKGWEDLKNGNKLGGAADVTVGVAKLLFGGLSDVAGNKQATLEHIAQNAPQLLVGLFGKAGATAQMVDNVSAAADTYNKGIQDYQAKNGGALPPEDQRQYMAFMAATSAAAEQVGDKIGLAATKLGGEVVKDVSRASFKSALKGTAVAVGEGVLSEAPTEAWQQFAEGEILGKPATGAEIFAAGVIGGASGGGLSGGGRAVHEAAKLAVQPTAAKQETIDQRKVQEAAIASGDVSKITDPVEQIAALVGHSQKADTTPEQKQTNLAKASEIVSALEEKQAEAEQVLSTSTVAGVQALIAERQAQLTDPEVANDPAKVALFTQSIELAQADLADLVNSKDQKGIETAAQKQLDTVKTQLQEAKLAKDNLELLVQPSSSVDEDIALISAPSQEEANDALTAGVAPRATAAGGVSQEQTAAADRIITLAMTAPERLDTSVVAKLAADTSNALTVPQRTFLKAFLRAQQSNPDLTSSLVAKDIYRGEYGNKGVLQFRAAMGKALAAGNQKMADAELTGKDGIVNFARAHQAKADAAAQALKLGLGTSILKEGGQWVVGAPGVAVTAEQHKAGGRTITSGRHALNIKNEAQALADVASELQAAYDLKFNAPKEASNVKNVSQQGTGAKTKEEGTTDQAAKPTGDSVAVESVSATYGKPTGVVGTSVVEADGVTATQAEYDEAVRVKNSSNEDDYDSVPGNIAKLITAMNDGTEIKISPVEKTASTEETPVSSVNTKSTETTKETTEEVKSTTELTTSEPTQPDGKLEVMATKSPEGTPFNLRNLIADNFTQAGGKPLTDVKNFFSFLYTKIDEQPAAIQSFLKHAKVWNERIKAGLSSVGNPDYRYEDMMRFLITDKDGIADIDENIKTAISSVVYLYVASEATSPQYHKDRGINSILGRGKTDWVSPAAREQLAHVGVYQYQLVDSLGGAVMEALGFKANPDAGLENEAKLRVALGAHAMKLLEGGNNPLMTRHTVSGETIQYLREEGLDEKQLARLLKSQGTTDTGAPHTFFSIARNPDGTVVPGVARIFEANKGSKDILGQLFKAPPTVKLPSLVPVTEVAKTAAGTNQSVPEEQQEALKIMQSREHFVREDSLDFLGEFSEEDQLTMMGVVEEESATTHRVNRISVQAKNDGLRREWTNFQEYVGEYLATAEKKLKTPFFFKFSPWKNQRTGIDNTVVNPQTSKIVRALVTSARWETEIALDNKELMDSFYLGVAEGLGVKTERQDNQLSVDAIIDTLTTPIYADAVAAIRKRLIHKESLSDQEKDAVLLAVAKGGANLHSLDALIGMAYHAEAVATKATTFVSRVYREVDGVANGTMLNHVLLGAAENQEALAAMLEHGGFFGKDSQYTHYSHYRGTTGNMDIYESTGRKVHEEVTAAVGKAGNAVVDSIWVIGGSIFDPATGIVSKAGRNLVKDGMNPLGFGSALDTVVAKMGTTFVDTIYTGFEKLAKSGAPQTEIDEFVAHINTLIGKTNTTAHIPVNKPIAFYMEMVLTNNSRNAILDSFSGTVGLITSNVLESEFKVFLERRNDLNSAAQTVSGMYDAMQRGIREDYIEQLIARGDIELDKAGNPVSDLSKAQEAELTRLLQSMAPVLRTAMSKNDTKGNGTRSGLLMSKTRRKQSNNPAYKTVSKFATGLSTGAKSVKLTALGKFFETIGVSMGSAATHSTDSRIMLMVQKMLDVLGIHDAAIDGIKGAKETANLLNKNTWDTLLNYSPLEEVYLSLANLVQGMAEVIENGDMPPQSLHYVNVFLAEQRWKQRIVGNTLQGLLTKAKKSAHTADETKLGFMSTSGVIDQYAFQGGQYQVTQANRDEAAQNLETLSDKIPKEILDALAVVQKALKNPGAMKRPVAPVAEATEATEDTAEDAEGSWFDALDELVKGPETSPFGELGESEFANRPEVLEAQKLELFLLDNPNTTAHTLLKEVYALLKARPASPTRDFRLQLLDRLRLTIHKDIKVHLITENTKGSEHTSRPPYKGAAAWFDADGAGLFFMSSGFKSSYFTVEAILHEMTHDALHTVVEAAERGEGSEQSNQMVKELQDLLKEARIFAKKNGLDVKHKLPLENLHEFLAYGLTRTGFQTDVLMAMQAPTKKGAISGLTKFVQTVIGILFKGSKDQLVMNGFTAFITNADGLFTSSQRTRELSDGNYSESDTTFTESNTENSVVTSIDPSAPFKLNEGQQSAYDAAVAFLKSKKESFSIIGSAGTGKTTIVKTILDNLAKEGVPKFSRIVLTSPTHRANAVTRSKNSSADIVTLHKLLGLSPTVNLEAFDARNMKFEKKAEGETETMPTNGLLIVDESSMINDALFEVLMREAKAAGTKVIFLGDMAQLGPVKQTTESKALISTDGQTNLTQVMRAKNAALLDESVALRQTGVFSAVSSMVQGNGVRFMNSSEDFINRAVKFFTAEEFKKNPLLVRVLAYSNAKATHYNKAIRAAIHGKDAAAYVPGDLLMGYAAFGAVHKDTGMSQISNGVDYIVQSVGGTKTGMLFGVQVEVVTLTVKDVFGLNKSVSLEVVSPTTPSATIQKIGAAAQAVIAATKTDRSKWRMFQTEKARYALPFDLTADDDGRPTTVIVKTLDYGYAHTIHKSQGGTYTFAMVDGNDVNAARTEKDRNRLRYVGLTRAERGAFVLTDATITDEQTAQVDPVVIETNQETGDKPGLVSPFGLVGESRPAPETEMVKFFTKTPQSTAKEVMAFLGTQIANPFQRKLLQALTKVVDPNLPIVMLTAKTRDDEVIAKHDQDVLAWFAESSRESAIYLKGPDFVNSGLRVETILHEIVHAATSQAINTGISSTKAYVAELNTLLTQARALAKSRGITKFDTNALSNIDELVAWGMTSKVFQDEILKAVQMKSTVLGTMADGMRVFVNTLARLIGIKDAEISNGLGVLIANVAGLMEQTAAMNDAFAGPAPRTLAMAAPTNTYSTIDIHDALADGSLTNEFDEHLRRLLGGIVYNLHGAFGSFKKTLMKNQTIDATDVWLKALNTGVAPFASEALGHIAATPQVAYALEQVEATVRAALETNESQTKMVYRELYKLYTEAEKIVTVQSLVDAGLDAVTAQATHDMLFKLEKTSGNRSNYLARFAALGLAHPVINQVLQAATARDSRTAKDAKTFLERLEIIFENLLRVFQTYVTRTYQGQPANDKLLSLVGQLVDIEAKYQRKIEDKASKSNYLEPLEAKIKVFVEAAGAKIEAVADSSYIRNHKNTYVKVAGGLVGTVAGGRADIFMDELFKLRAEVFKKRFGVVASLAQAYVGQNVVLQGLLRMTKLLEGDRQDQVAGWAKSALEAFADSGKMLRGKAKDNVAARASISSVFMRTGAHNLMGDFDMAGIEQLVTDKTALNTAITSFENQLAVHGKAAPYYVNQANALGYQKATGVARTKFVNQNAHAISKLAGTGQESRVSTAQAEQAEATLKVLVTLYALRYSNDIAVGHAGRVIKAENQRADGMNGLEFTLLLQKRLEKESLERLFGNNPMLMVHGYTSEIYDPYVSIKTANVLEGKALVEQGYVQRSVVPVDPADADQDIKHIYVLQDGGMPRFVSGAISNRGMQAKGKTIHNGYLNVYNATGIANAAQNAALVQDRQAAIADMFRPGPVKDLSKEKGNYLVPVFNEYGKVVNWRYMMAETTKDNILNRNNRFDKVLGTIAGSIYDKETSREQNMASVKALYEQYQTDYKNNPKSYVDISPKSDDPEMREIWNLLPEDTRKDILSVWGRNGMTVKTENLDIMFGYRKLSVGTIFQKANEERDARKAAGERTEVMSLKTIDAWQKLIVLVFESPLKGEALVKGKTMEEALRYARKAGDNAVRTEHIWQAIMSEAKDIIVVKSGLVLLGNMGSNIWLLGMSGVPILDVMGHHLVAWKGAVSWKKDTEELEHLKRLRDTGYTQGNKADIDRRILRLEDALDRNPVKELVEAGLMPTIVEDINPEDDLYSYKSQLVRKVETVTDKMNPTLVKAARTAYLAHDTKIYQAMSQITKLSDFMARYTMYQHLISKKDPLSKSEATQKVSEAFINYDIALHRSIQYTDDMGITMFTKYFIGIQKVLMDTVRENPARVLTGVLLSKFLGLGPTVLDGSMWNHIGNNPLRSGPFELLDAISELPMVNAPLAMFNMGGSPAP